MSNELLFSITNGIALLAWLVLLVFPFRPFTNKLLIGVGVALLCVTYSVLVYQLFQPGDFQKFRTLEGIITLLSEPGMALAGWVHYLAFDLMAGLFIANNAAKHGITHAWIVPCLILTFMLGPVGLMLYLLIRWAVVKQYWVDNF